MKLTCECGNEVQFFKDERGYSKESPLYDYKLGRMSVNIGDGGIVIVCFKCKKKMILWETEE